jgi:hypothetical protein
MSACGSKRWPNDRVAFAQLRTIRLSLQQLARRREAWTAGLVAISTSDPETLDALLEGVLWHGAERADDLVMRVGAALCDAAENGGRRALEKLSQHPSEAVVLRVAALRRRAADLPVEPDRPPPAGFLDAVKRIASATGAARLGPSRRSGIGRSKGWSRRRSKAQPPGSSNPMRRTGAGTRSRSPRGC